MAQQGQYVKAVGLIVDLPVCMRSACSRADSKTPTRQLTGLPAYRHVPVHTDSQAAYLWLRFQPKRAVLNALAIDTLAPGSVVRCKPDD